MQDPLGSQQDPAQIQPATEGTRRRRTIPTIQLSKATIWASVLAVSAAASIGVGVTQLRHWDAVEMTEAEGQRAAVDFIAVAALAVLFALVAAVVWGVSVITSRMAANRLDLIRGASALRIQVGEVSAKLDLIIGRMDGRSEFAVGYLTAAKRRLTSPGPSAPAGRTDSRGPETY